MFAVNFTHDHGSTAWSADIADGRTVCIETTLDGATVITVEVGNQTWTFTAPDEQDFVYIEQDGAPIAKASI